MHKILLGDAGGGGGGGAYTHCPVGGRSGECSPRNIWMSNWVHFQLLKGVKC